MNLEQETFHVTKHESEIADILTTIDPVAVADLIAELTQGDESFATETAAKIAAIEQSINREITCEKTGAQLAFWDDEKLASLVNSCAPERAIEIVAIQSRGHVKPEWLFTDDTALNELSRNDPRGYFVYAASCILRVFQPYFQKKEFFDTNTTENDHWRRDKATLRSQIDGYLVEDLFRINELMKRYLTFTQTVSVIAHLAFTNTRFNSFASSHESLLNFEREIKRSLRKILAYLISKSKITNTLSYADIVNVRLHIKGHSNFRRQGTLRAMTDIERTIHAIKQFMPVKIVPVQIATASGRERLQTEMNDKATAWENRNMVKAVKHHGKFNLTGKKM